MVKLGVTNNPAFTDLALIPAYRPRINYRNIFGAREIIFDKKSFYQL
jgi:hypothetical protein